MLEIRLLGQYDVRVDGHPVEIASRPSRLLFAYLALSAGTHHPRERLAGLLWPESDESNARSNLRQALWRLRKSIGDEYLLSDSATVAFNAEVDFWLDTAVLEARGDENLAEAARVYTGELLPGYYDDWVQLERERLQAMFERTMQRLLEALAKQRSWSQVLQWAEHWISFGQTPEPAYRALMMAHAAQGDLAAVADAYERCLSTLQIEVGVEPSPETRKLRDHLLQSNDVQTPAFLSPDEGITEAAAKHNLPHQPTRFIGRQWELTQVRQLLASARLLTLVGPGGTGKTRLALQVASELAGAYRNGVYFVSLAPIETPDLMVQTIAEAIGFPLSSHEDPESQLLRHLRRRQYLLVLDNFEHVLPGARLVSRILQQAGEVSILGTSQERLNLKEETAVRVEGLDYPSSSSTPDALNFGAVRLFLDSAKRMRPGFLAGPDQLPHIVRICQLLEGLPLGILLAAAWIDVLTPEEIAGEITRSLDFLQAEWRDVPSRHLSVRAAFEPSWKRLTEAQRELFARLAVFRGGFSREAAEVVADASLRELSALVSKSLLRRDLDSGRYEMHELLRQFAWEHLGVSSEARTVVTKAHALYFADFMQEQWTNLAGPHQRTALAQIDADLENLRQAWRYWLARQDARRIKMFIDSFWRVYDIRGWFNPGAELFSEAAAILRSAGDAASDDETKVVYARLVGHLAFFNASLGYAEDGLIQAQESVELLRSLNRRQELAFPLTNLQYNASYVEVPEKAMSFDLGEVEFSSDRDGQWKRAYVTCWQGRSLAWRRDSVRAKERVKESLKLFEGLGDEIATIWGWIELGMFAVLGGSYQEARGNFERVRRIAEEYDFGWATVKATRYLGNMALIMGQPQEARSFLLRSLRLADELGMLRDVVNALYDVATVEAAAGNVETAIRFLEVVRQHPLSDQTRTFSIWSGDQELRFRSLADTLLARLKGQVSPSVYDAALEDGSALDLDGVVMELLKS